VYQPLYKYTLDTLICHKKHTYVPFVLQHTSPSNSHSSYLQ